MIGKVIKISDYNLTYGKEEIHANVYGAFKSIKNGNKYVIYNYVEDKTKKNKVYYGSLFIRNNELVVMLSKDTKEDIIKEFIDSIITNKGTEEYEIIKLDNINSIQIIDDAPVSFNVDINTLHEKTIPKVEETDKEPKPKKKISITYFFFALFIIVLILFFFVNPEVLTGKNIEYICSKNYQHEELNATTAEEIELIFTPKEQITTINITTSYIFNDADEYNTFKNNGYYYQYMEKGDTYKLEDDSYTYKVFSKIETSNDYFMPTNKEELITYYEDKDYTCKEQPIK